MKLVRFTPLPEDSPLLLRRTKPTRPISVGAANPLQKAGDFFTDFNRAMPIFIGILGVAFIAIMANDERKRKKGLL